MLVKSRLVSHSELSFAYRCDNGHRRNDPMVKVLPELKLHVASDLVKLRNSGNETLFGLD